MFFDPSCITDVSLVAHLRCQVSAPFPRNPSMALVPLLGTFFRVKDEGCGESKILDMYMAGVQNSRSKGSYKVGPIGIAKLILHLRYEAGPIGNHAVPKLGASIALAWRQ